MVEPNQLDGHNGTYRLREQIGQGAFGITYLADRERADRPVVVKQLKVEHLEDWKALELFEREASVLAELDHPSIPEYLDHFSRSDGEALEGLYLVQEYVEGESLQTYLTSSATLSVDEMRDWFFEVLDVCAYLHDRQPPVIHRDIAPKNVMLTPDRDDAYLIDFGTVQAKLRSEATVGSTSAGTYGYAPAEQFVGRAVPASDLYGLGATFLAVAAGRRPNEMPFEGNRFVVDEILDEQEYGSHWVETLRAMTAPNVDRRPQSAEEVRRGLEVTSAGIRDEAASQAKERESSESSGSAVWMVAAMVVVGLIAYAAAMEQRMPESDSESTAAEESASDAEERLAAGQAMNFNINQYRSRVDQRAREWLGGRVVFAGLEADGVRPDGTVNLTRGDHDGVVYWYAAPERMLKYLRLRAERKPAQARQVECLFEVTVTEQGIAVGESMESCSRFEQMHRVRCTPAEVWKRARVRGVPAEEESGRRGRPPEPRTASLVLRHTETSPRWVFDAGDPYTLEIPDACKGPETERTTFARPNFSAFRPLEQFDNVERLARSFDPSATPVLERLEIEGAETGGLDVTGSASTVTYEFRLTDRDGDRTGFAQRLRTRDRKVELLVDEPTPTCPKLAVRVHDGVVTTAFLDEECETVREVEPPSCSVSAILERAGARAGGTEDASGPRLRYARGDGDRGRWSVDGDAFEGTLSDECDGP